MLAPFLGLISDAILVPVVPPTILATISPRDIHPIRPAVPVVGSPAKIDPVRRPHMRIIGRLRLRLGLGLSPSLDLLNCPLNLLSVSLGHWLLLVNFFPGVGILQSVPKLLTKRLE